MVSIHREGCSQRSAPQKRHMTHLRRCAGCIPRKSSGWDRGGDKSQPSTGGDSASREPGHLSCSDQGWTQNAGPTKSAPLWSTRKPEPEWLRPGKCMHTRACIRQFPAEQPRVWAVQTGKAHMPWAGANPVWLKHSNHMPVIFVCSVLTSPQHDWTSEPKKSDHHSPPCVRVEIRHWRDQQREEAKINRGNHFGSDRCNGLKPWS